MLWQNCCLKTACCEQRQFRNSNNFPLDTVMFTALSRREVVSKGSALEGTSRYGSAPTVHAVHLKSRLLLAQKYLPNSEGIV